MAAASRRISTMVDPMKAPAPGNRLPFRRGSVEYCLGTEADHEAVYQTLLHVFHGPDRESFLGAAPTRHIDPISVSWPKSMAASSAMST